MRTTVELTDDLRARLLELAARRGEKGFSKIVQQAVERYLTDLEGRKERASRALSVLGKLDEKNATALVASVKRIRRTWR